MSGSPARQLGMTIRAGTGLVVRTVRRLRNWPEVLSVYVGARLARGAAPGRETAFVFRDGTRMVSRPDQAVAYPVFEVLIDDAYRIAWLRDMLGGEIRAVVDVGAHVGSAAVACARAWP